MKKIFLLLLIIILTLGLFNGCAPTTPPTPSPSEGEGEEEPTGDRVVLVELFNTEGCKASAVINPIMEKLAEEYGTNQVILVEEAGWGKYTTPEVKERFSWYVPGTKHTPFIAFNGLSDTFSEGVSGGGGGGGTPTPTNHAPVISSIIANPENICPNDSSVITCNATDQDGDSLNYSWTKTGGTITGSGKTITWTAPASADIYTITCIVSDGKGGEDSKSTNITVLPSVGNKLFLESGGTLNGTSINPSNPTLTVNSGGSITGTLKVQAIYSGPSSNVVPFGYTPSWGSHSSSYVTVISDLPVGTFTYDVSINLNSPTTPRTYYLVFASNCEMNLGWTMSQTNWTTGTMSWDDGNDIADLTESKLQDSLSTGYLYLDMLVGSTYSKSNYGIAYVKINVEATVEITNTATFTCDNQNTVIAECIVALTQ